MVIFLKNKNQTEGEENREFPKAYQKRTHAHIYELRRSLPSSTYLQKK